MAWAPALWSPLCTTRAAILAHIAARPDLYDQDPYAGDSNVRRMMRRVQDLFSINRQYFTDPDGYVLCAILGGEIALPDQLDIMKEYLRRIGSKPRVEHYRVPSDQQDGRGTVVTVGPQDDDYVDVFIEGYRVSHRQRFTRCSSTGGLAWIWVGWCLIGIMRGGRCWFASFV